MSGQGALFTMPPTVREPASLAGPIRQPSLIDAADEITTWTDERSVSARFTRRAETAETHRARLDTARDTLAAAASRFEPHAHGVMVHADMVAHLRDVHGVAGLGLLTGIGTQRIDAAHKAAHDNREG